MPLPGEQHRESAATANPFIEQKTHVTEYTAREIANLQSRLNKQLGPEYISTRPGAGGGKVHYLAAEKVIGLANEVFGFNGWSSSIQNVQIDFVDENAQTGKITLGLSTIVRVTLRDGSFHEDIGYGHIENCKGKAAAFEKAKKEATTDALKRALRNFGNVLGNCLYDKDYLKRVEKIKIAPSRWDAENLHRHQDYAPEKPDTTNGPAPRQEEKGATKTALPAQRRASFGSAEMDDEFGGNLLDETDFSHPDEVRVEDTNVASANVSPAKKAIAPPPPRPTITPGSIPRMPSLPQLRPSNGQSPQPPPNLQQLQRQVSMQRPPQGIPPRPQHLNSTNQAQSMGEDPRSSSSTGTNTVEQASAPKLHQPADEVLGTRQQFDAQGVAIPMEPPPGHPEGFLSGRSIQALGEKPAVGQKPTAFNPHAETPSIRRTQGVNPGKSAPISRQVLDGGRSPQINGAGGQSMHGVNTPGRTNFVNPAADLNRKIGMPQMQGGMGNRGAYKPPSAVGVKRPPLADISSNLQGDGSAEKKARLEGEKPAQAADSAERNNDYVDAQQ